MEKSIVPYLALLLVQLLFGFNFAASKIVLNSYPALPWAAVRMSIAAVFMFIASMIVVPKEQRKVDLNFLKKTFIYGLFGIALCQSFFLIGLKNTTITNSAVLSTLTPIFTLLFGIIGGREKFTWNRAIGFLIALSGVLILRHIEDFQASMDTMKGDLFTLLNCAALAFFFSISREFMKVNSAFWATAWMFLFGAILIGVFCLITGVPPMTSEMNGSLIGAALYSIIGATILTYFLNSWTLKKVPASSVAVFIYLQPVIAVSYAWFAQDQPPTMRTIVSVMCIFCGVLLGVVVKPKKVEEKLVAV